MVYQGKPSTGCKNCRTRRIKVFSGIWELVDLVEKTNRFSATKPVPIAMHARGQAAHARGIYTHLMSC